MVAADCIRFRSGSETVVAPAALNNHHNLAALTIVAPLTRAREGTGAPMMALAARCELRVARDSHPVSQSVRGTLFSYPCPRSTRARGGWGEPLTLARAIEIASEIGVVRPCSARAAAARGRARIGVSRPTCSAAGAPRRPSGSRRLLLDSMAGIGAGLTMALGRSLDEPRRAPAVAEFCSFYESRIGADDGARAIERTLDEAAERMRRPWRGRW